MTPYVVILTSHHLALEAVLVAPMFIAPLTTDKAEVSVRFDDVDHVLSLIDMAAIEPRRLRKKVGSIAEHEEAIQRALHRLFTGF